MSEPQVIYATVREAVHREDPNDTILHIECRFDDGQKFAAVTVDAQFDHLAHRIADFLCEPTSPTKLEASRALLDVVLDRCAEFIADFGAIRSIAAGEAPHATDPERLDKILKIAAQRTTAVYERMLANGVEPPTAAEIIAATHPDAIRSRDLLTMELVWQTFDRLLFDQIGADPDYDDVMRKLFAVFVRAKELRLRKRP